MSLANWTSPFEVADPSLHGRLSSTISPCARVFVKPAVLGRDFPRLSSLTQGHEPYFLFPLRLSSWTMDDEELLNNSEIFIGATKPLAVAPSDASFRDRLLGHGSEFSSYFLFPFSAGFSGFRPPACRMTTRSRRRHNRPHGPQPKRQSCLTEFSPDLILLGTLPP